MKEIRNLWGFDGFVFFLGIVEDRKDPLKLGRVRIRDFYAHTENKSLIPTEEIPWAQPIIPPNMTNTVHAPKEGDMIFGFYIDGEEKQYPYYFGKFNEIPEKLYPNNVGFSDPGKTLEERPVDIESRQLSDKEGYSYVDKEPARYPNILNEPTTSRLGRNEKIDQTLIQFRKDHKVKVDSVGNNKWEEPETSYNSNYPYNHATYTESGHVFDLDDTKGKENILLSHRTGTAIEMYPNGDKLEKIVRNNYEIIHGNDKINVRGNIDLTCEKVGNIRIKGKTNIELDDDCDILIKGNKTQEIDKNETHLVKGSQTITIEGNQNIVVKGSCTVTVTGKLSIISSTGADILTPGAINVIGTSMVNVTSGGSINVLAPDVNISGD